MESSLSRQETLDFPWSDLQQWTLDSALPRYTIQVNERAITLWRNLAKDHVELTGYPTDFLMAQSMNEGGMELPFLDQFEFTPNGGLSGQAYGLQGIAPGTVIETTPVGNVRLTIPKGFVHTQDGSLFELGEPRSSETSSAGYYSLNGMTQQQSQLAPSSSNAWGLDSDIYNLGALTAAVIGGALAVESMSHHLTVNVFWV